MTPKRRRYLVTGFGLIPMAGAALAAWLLVSAPQPPELELRNAISATLNARSWTLDRTEYLIEGGGSTFLGPIHIRDVVVYQRPDQLLTQEYQLGGASQNVLCVGLVPCQEVRQIDIGVRSWITQAPSTSSQALGPFVAVSKGGTSGEFAVHFGIETQTLVLVMNVYLQRAHDHVTQEGSTFTLSLTGKSNVPTGAGGVFQRQRFTTTEVFQVRDGRVMAVRVRQTTSNGVLLLLEEDAFSAFGSSPPVVPPS